MQYILTPEQSALNQRAIELCQKYLRIEWPIIEVLQQVDEAKLYKYLGESSLFQYAVRVLGLSEPVAGCFITVAKKAKVVTKLNEALQANALSVSRASRITSAINEENAIELIEFAKTHSKRDVDLKMASLNPKSARRERVKPINAELYEVTVYIPKETLDTWKRAQSVVAQNKQKHPTLAATLKEMGEEFLKHKDPIKRAERILAKKKKKAEPDPRTQEHCPDRVSRLSAQKPVKRKPLPAGLKHQVFKRDAGVCTHINSRGERCNVDRWLHIHHIRPVSHGGSNDLENLTTLCSIHHDLIHQLTLPNEALVTWLRSPQSVYCKSKLDS